MWLTVDPARHLPAQALGIDTVALEADARFLSHDRLLGRDTGSEGARIAAKYIAAQCHAIGLDQVGGVFQHPVPLVVAQVTADTKLIIEHFNRREEFTSATDFIPGRGTRGTLVGFSGPAVFVGTSGEVSSTGAPTIPLNGAVAVVAGRATRQAAVWLAAYGATGIVQLIAPIEQYEALRDQIGTSRFFTSSGDVGSSYHLVLPTILAAPPVARSLLAEAVSRRGRIIPQILRRRVAVQLSLDARAVDATNVVCLLPGSSPTARDTVIAFAAHYDHLGVGLPDATGDTVYNGFSDNAAGVAMLLAIARIMRAAPPSHSVLFLFFTGEERGLLGSDYYVTHPLVPLDRMLAVLTLDAGAPPAPPTSWELAGVDSTGLGRIALDVAGRAGWQIKTSHARPNSDYYPFTLKDVPGLLIIPGQGPYEGLSSDESLALRRRWDRYHLPSDEWDPQFPLDGLARYAEFAVLIARELDGRPDLR